MLTNVLLGTLGVLVGLVVTFYGYAIFRLMLPIVGFFYGFALGHALFDTPFWGWTFGIIFALALAVLAYSFWSALVTLGGALIGFGLGFMFGEWLGLWEWVSVIIGVVLGAGFAGLFYVYKDLMVMANTAFAGAGLIFAGLATFWPALLGWMGPDGTSAVGNWITLILTIVVGVIGLIAQMFIFSGLHYYSEPSPDGPPWIGAPAAKAG